MNVTLMSELEILNAALAVGWVKFSYWKKDGSHRLAIGTRNPSLINEIKGNTERKERDRYAESVFPYFDLSRGDFRCFLKENFDKIELERMTNKQAVAQAMTIAYSMSDISAEQYQDVLAACNGLVEHDFVSKVADALNDMPADLANDNDDFERAYLIVQRKVNASVPSFASTEQVVSGRVVEHKTRREELIAELLEIRKRESEILAELLQ